MRLRKLGTTQSLVFFLPPEVHQSIMHLCKKRLGDYFDSNEVVRWLLEQTCVGIEQLQPLFYSQGVDFCRRTQGLANKSVLTKEDDRENYVDIIRQPEKQTLQQLYQPISLRKKARASATVMSPQITHFMQELHSRRKVFQDTSGAVQASALQEVEQEREVAYEVQAIRESQRPVHYSPLSFRGLSQELSRFVETGRLSVFSQSCDHFLEYLGHTNLGLKYRINVSRERSNLYLSKEFSRTVVLPNAIPNSDFMVSWVHLQFGKNNPDNHATAPTDVDSLEYRN